MRLVFDRGTVLWLDAPRDVEVADLPGHQLPPGQWRKQKRDRVEFYERTK